jgi:hypothetical protein
VCLHISPLLLLLKGLTTARTWEGGNVDNNNSGKKNINAMKAMGEWRYRSTFS